MNTKPQSQKQLYDHRLREGVRETGDITFALELGVPRSTATGCLAAPHRPVISHEFFDLSDRAKIKAKESITIEFASDSKKQDRWTAPILSGIEIVEE